MSPKGIEDNVLRAAMDALKPISKSFVSIENNNVDRLSIQHDAMISTLATEALNDIWQNLRQQDLAQEKREIMRKLEKMALVMQSDNTQKSAHDIYKILDTFVSLADDFAKNDDRSAQAMTPVGNKIMKKLHLQNQKSNTHSILSERTKQITKEAKYLTREWNMDSIGDGKRSGLSAPIAIPLYSILKKMSRGGHKKLARKAKFVGSGRGAISKNNSVFKRAISASVALQLKKKHNIGVSKDIIDKIIELSENIKRDLSSVSKSEIVDIVQDMRQNASSVPLFNSNNDHGFGRGI